MPGPQLRYKVPGATSLDGADRGDDQSKTDRMRSCTDLFHLDNRVAGLYPLHQ